MSKFQIPHSVISPGATAGGYVDFEEVTPGSYIGVDATKVTFPTGLMTVKTETNSSKTATRGHVRVNLPCLGKDGETVQSVTATITLTTENGGLAGAERAIDGQASNNASYAAFVALRTACVIALSSVDQSENTLGGIVALDAHASHDSTGLSAGDSNPRFGNLFVRGQLGVPMIPDDQIVGGNGSETVVIVD